MKFSIKRLLYFTAAIGLLLTWFVRPEMESQKIGRLFKNGQRSLLNIEVESLLESLHPFTDADMKNSRVEYSAWTYEQLICGYRRITISVPCEAGNTWGSLEIEVQIGVFRNRVMSISEPLRHPPFDPDTL